MSESRTQIRAEPGSKRVRVYLGGHLVADTLRPLLVWEKPHYPTYYLPEQDVRAQLDPTGDTRSSELLGVAERYDVRIGGHLAPGAAGRYLDSPVAALRGNVRLDWAAMDAWFEEFEEDEEVFVHPRDPYKRVDALRSTRHVVVELDGHVLADTRAPVILYETGLPPRHYLPATDVRQELLVPSETVTHCPYKGSTVYYHVRVDEREEPDLAWSYPTPRVEALPVAGFICFPAERTEVRVDGLLQ